MKPELDVLVDIACVLGENPLWDPGEGRLYWTDITRGHLYFYDFATRLHTRFYEGETVGGFTLQEDGALLLFMGKGSVKVLKDGALRTVLEEIPEERESRFNDVIADPLGRVFCGTMSSAKHPGALYRLDPDGSLSRVVEGVGTSNGIGFSPDHRFMYYTDSPKHIIYRFEYDEATGEIRNRKVFIETSENLGVPDGMTVDSEGFLWSANWNGSCLIRYTPEGKEVLRLEFPAKKVSSVIFGGPSYEDVFVTTAGGDQRASEGSGAGAVFHFRPGVRGLPEYQSKIRT